MKEISVEDSHKILEKMFSCIGLVYDPILVSQINWYYKTDWGKSENKENFLVWLTDFLIKNEYSTKNRARHEAEKINAIYGWKEIK